MTFAITCNKCGSKQIDICATIYDEIDIECKDCGQHFVGEVNKGIFIESK